MGRNKQLQNDEVQMLHMRGLTIIEALPEYVQEAPDQLWTAPVLQGAHSDKMRTIFVYNVDPAFISLHCFQTTLPCTSLRSRPSRMISLEKGHRDYTRLLV